MLSTTANKGFRTLALCIAAETFEDVLRLRGYLENALKSSNDPASKLFFNTLINQCEACLPQGDSFDELAPGDNPTPFQKEMMASNKHSDYLLDNLNHVNTYQVSGNKVDNDLVAKSWVVQRRRLDTEEVLWESEPFEHLTSAEHNRDVRSNSIKEGDDVFYDISPVL